MNMDSRWKRASCAVGISALLLGVSAGNASAEPAAIEPAAAAVSDSATAPEPTTADAASADSAAGARDDDNAVYGELEAQSDEAARYQGGDTLVIGATTATAILAVILLVVLL